MKRNSIYTVIASVAMVLTLSSCSDFLDKEPSNKLTEEDVMGDWALIEQFHLDTYNFLRHGALRINNSWLDAATDLAECSSSTSGVRNSFNVGDYFNGLGGPELTATWEHYYRAIRKCNVIVNRIEEVPHPLDQSEELYETNKKNYIAEARFLRAWFYWELFLRYGPIPVVTEVLQPDGDLVTGYTERPTVKEYVVDFILKELEECEEDLKSYADVGTDQSGRISQPIARALRSRIMLFMASPRYSADSEVTWEEARDVIKSFFDDYGDLYQLMKVDQGSVSAYNNAWALTPYNDKNTETIFFRNDGNIGWGNISADTPVGEGGFGGNCPSQNLVDMYDMVDGQSPFTEYDETGAPVYTNGKPTVNAASGYNDNKMWVNRDPRMASTILYQGVSWGNGVINVIHGQRDNPISNPNATPTGYYMRKYIPETILYNEHVGTAKRLWKIIGLAEMMLSYAEAENEVSGPDAIVIDMLDQIRQRGGIVGSVADRTDLTTQEAMRKFIRKERTVELAMEEHRWWDVRRWNVAVEALSRDIYGVDVMANGAIVRKVAQHRVFEEKMYLYPIPEAEEWKTSIENNPGW